MPCARPSSPGRRDAGGPRPGLRRRARARRATRAPARRSRGRARRPWRCPTRSAPRPDRSEWGRCSSPTSSRRPPPSLRRARASPRSMRIATLLGRLAPDEIVAATGLPRRRSAAGTHRHRLGHDPRPRRHAGDRTDAHDRRRRARDRRRPRRHRRRFGARPARDPRGALRARDRARGRLPPPPPPRRAAARRARRGDDRRDRASGRACRSRSCGGPRCSAATCASTARLALTEGVDALAAVRLELLAADPTDARVHRRGRHGRARSDRTGVGRVEARRRAHPGPPRATTKCGSTPATSTRSPIACPKSSPRCAPSRRATLVLDGEAIGLSDDERPHRFQDTMSRFGRQQVDAHGIPLTRVLLRRPAHRRPRPARRTARGAARRARRRIAGERTIPSVRTDDPGVAAEMLETALAAGHEGVMVKALDVAVRGGPPRRRVAQGEAGAHARPRRARRRVGQRPAPRAGCRTCTSARAARTASS